MHLQNLESLINKGTTAEATIGIKRGCTAPIVLLHTKKGTHCKKPARVRKRGTKHDRGQGVRAGRGVGTKQRLKMESARLVRISEAG